MFMKIRPPWLDQGFREYTDDRAAWPAARRILCRLTATRDNRHIRKWRNDGGSQTNEVLSTAVSRAPLSFNSAMTLPESLDQRLLTGFGLLWKFGLFCHSASGNGKHVN
jgi:hypothetical protein